MLSIYRVAFATVPRCPSIYLAILLFWILIGVVMVGAMIVVAIALFSILPAGMLYLDFYAGIRFIFGAYIALFLAWGAIYWFFIILLRAGLAGMFLRLHQGDRPGLADFGRGIARYIWRFLKGYFHIAILYAIPLIIVLSWMMLRYAAYSSLIYESRWNTGLRFDFIMGNRIALDIATGIIALMYCFLMVWDESVVLEGSSFSGGFIRSTRFAVRNIARLLPVAIINFVIMRTPLFIAEGMVAATGRSLEHVPSGYAFNPLHQFGVLSSLLGPALAAAAVLIFIISPIIAYTHYLLYIPNRPFKPTPRWRPKASQEYLRASEEPEDDYSDAVISDTGTPLSRPLRYNKEDIPDFLINKKDKYRIQPVPRDEGGEPDDDFLRLDK